MNHVSALSTKIKRPVRVLFISSGLGVGGAETMLLCLLEHIDRRLIMPAVISLTGLGAIGPKIQALDIPVEDVGLSRGSNPFPLVSLIRLCRQISSFRPDVVQTWQYHADLLGGIAARIAGVQTVSWGIRNGDLPLDYSKNAIRLIRSLSGVLSYRVPKAILFNSQSARAVHVKEGYDTSKMEVIPNGFDLMRYTPNQKSRRSLRDELGLSPDVLLGGFVARDDPVKNHEGFLRAVRLVHVEMPDVHFVLAGHMGCQSNRRLCQIIADKQISDSVHILGHREDIPEVLAALDVLVLASDTEAFPNVLGEAMACGVPCVATAAGDSAWIIGDTGRVVRIGDMEALAKKILELLVMGLERRRALGMKARLRIKKNFDVRQIAMEYERYFLSLASQS